MAASHGTYGTPGGRMGLAAEPELRGRRRDPESSTIVSHACRWSDRQLKQQPWPQYWFRRHAVKYRVMNWVDRLAALVMVTWGRDGRPHSN
ncbi:SCO3870 family protein [Streptomyces sp. G6]|uniref:SCO3870 family protein n=1 Tax=Streptomyces sp. G6 TaxID=1178736 RepID=UPI003EDA84FA